MMKRTELKQKMSELGISPEELAKQAKVARSSIYKFLDGKDIRLSTWEKIETCIHKEANS